MSSKALGGVLSVVNLCVWGCWPYARRECNADASKVITLLFLGEAGVIIIGSIISDIFFGSQAWSNLLTSLYSSQSPVQVLAILLGGFNIIWADFFILSAFVYLPTVIALPVVIGLMMGLGSSFDYMVQVEENSFNKAGRYSNQEASIMIFMAVLSSILAVTCLGGAHYFKDSSTIQNDNVLLIHENVTNRQKKQWFVICLFTGVLAASWSPLVTYGASGVADPFARLLLYIIGQGIGLIYILIAYSSNFYEHLNLRVPTVPARIDGADTHLSMIRLLSETFNLPRRDLFYGSLGGALLGIGYLLNFAASSMIPASVVFSIASCEPLATIFIGISPLYKEFNMEAAPKLNRIGAYLFLTLSVLLFLGSILINFQESS